MATTPAPGRAIRRERLSGDPALRELCQLNLLTYQHDGQNAVAFRFRAWHYNGPLGVVVRPTDRKTEDARSEVNAESGLARLADDGSSPMFLRNGTVYGLPPRMRVDTGANHLNQHIIELAKIALKAVRGCRPEVLPHSRADQRTYKADLGKFACTFPDFEFEWTATTCAHGLYDAFTRGGLTYATWIDEWFTGFGWLRHLLDAARLRGSPRWPRSARG